MRHLAGFGCRPCDPVKVWSAGRRSRRHHRLSRAESHVRRGTDEFLQRDCWHAERRFAIAAVGDVR
jgi:hypothetical protein